MEATVVPPSTSVDEDKQSHLPLRRSRGNKETIFPRRTIDIDLKRGSGLR